MRPITERQASILNYVVSQIQSEGCAPGIRDIAARFGIASNRGVTVHLDALDRKGYIRRANGVPHGIQVLKDSEGRKVRLAFVYDAEAPQ